MDRTNAPPQPTADDVKALAQVINTALKSKLSGQPQKYNLILQQLRTGTDAILYKLFLALHRCIHEISTNIHMFDDLLHILFSLRYRPIPADAVQALTNTQSLLNNVSSVLSSSTISSSTANAITSTTVLSSTASSTTTVSACMYSLTTVQAYSRLLQTLVTTNPANFLLPVCRTLIRGLTSTQQDADTYALLRAKNQIMNTVDSTTTEHNPTLSSLLTKIQSNSSTPYEILSMLPFAILQEISTLLTSYNEIIYSSLYTLLTNVPTGISSLFTTLAEAIPHKRLSVLLYETYIRHTLRLITLIPSLRDRMIAAIIDRMVDLDVDIILDLLPDIDEDTTTTTTTPATGTTHETKSMLERSASPGASSDTNNIDILTEETKQTEEDIARQATIQTATKLDTIFLLMLRYLHGTICNCDGNSTSNNKSSSSSSELSKLLSSNGIRPRPDPILDNDNGLACQCINQRLHQITGSSSSTSSSSSSSLSTDTNNSNHHHHPTQLSRTTPRVNPNENLEVREHMFALMLGVFERSVLLTHRSKFIQFLLFYTCALDNSFTDRFVGRLVTHIRNPERSPLWRATSAVYLGSFLARAATVDNTTVRSALYYMLEWAHGYVDLWDAHVSYTIQMMVMNGELDHPHSGHKPGHRSTSKPRTLHPSATATTTVDVTIATKTTSIIWETGSNTSASSSSSSSSDTDDDGSDEDSFTSGDDSSMTDGSSGSTVSTSSGSTGTSTDSSSNEEDDDDDEEDIDYHLIAPNLIPRYMDPELPPLPLPSLFHSIMQATFYVICFRAAEFRLLAGGVEFLANLQWDKLLESPLDPLAHCSEAVSREFARIVHVLRLAPHASLVTSAAYDILTASGPKETTKNEDDEDAAITNEAATHEDMTNPPNDRPRSNGIMMENTAMESFFPFDPFLLKDSSRYIAPIFRTWTASSIGFGIDTTFDWTETEGYDTGGALKHSLTMFSSGTESIGGEEGGGTYKRTNRGSGTESATKTQTRIRRNSYSEVLHRRKVSIGNESMELTDEGSVINQAKVKDDDSSVNSDSSDEGSSSSGIDDYSNEEDDLDHDEDNEIILPLPLSNAQEQILAQAMDTSTSLLARMRAGLANATGGTLPLPSSSSSHGHSLFTAGSSVLSSSILAPGLVAALDNAQATDGLLANLDIDINEYGFRNNHRSSSSTTDTDEEEDDDDHRANDEEDNDGGRNNGSTSLYYSPYQTNPYHYHRKNGNADDEEDEENNDDDDDDNNNDNESNSVISSNAPSYTKPFRNHSDTINSSPTGTNASSSVLGSPQNSPWLGGNQVLSHRNGLGGSGVGNSVYGTTVSNENENSTNNASGISLLLPPTMYTSNGNNDPTQRSLKPPTHPRKAYATNTNSTKSTPLLHGMKSGGGSHNDKGLQPPDMTLDDSLTHPGAAISSSSKPRKYSTTSNVSVSSRISSNNTENTANNSSTTSTNPDTGTTNTHTNSTGTSASQRRKKSIAGFETGIVTHSASKDNTSFIRTNMGVSSLVSSSTVVPMNSIHLSALSSSFTPTEGVNFFAGIGIIPKRNSPLPVPSSSFLGAHGTESVMNTVMNTSRSSQKRKLSSSSSESVHNAETENTDQRETVTHTLSSTDPVSSLDKSSSSNAPSWDIFTTMMSNAADQLKSTERFGNIEEEEKKTKNDKHLDNKDSGDDDTKETATIDNGNRKGGNKDKVSSSSSSAIVGTKTRSKRTKKE